MNYSYTYKLYSILNNDVRLVLKYQCVKSKIREDAFVFIFFLPYSAFFNGHITLTKPAVALLAIMGEARDCER